MEEIVSKEQCTGFMPCAEVCPYHAIQCRDEVNNGYYSLALTNQSVLTVVFVKGNVLNMRGIRMI